MSEEFEIYSDESCHLNNHDINVMGFGGIRIKKTAIRKAKDDIAKLKERFNCKGELKWTKVSPKNTDFYKSLIDFFVTSEDIEFHSVIIKDKTKLNHQKYNQGSETIFYYKMYFLLLKNIISRKSAEYRIFMDIKQKHTAMEVSKLKRYLQNQLYKETETSISTIQTADSKCVSILQLADFLLGAIMYANRYGNNSTTKGQLVKYLEEKINIQLTSKTKYSDKKMHIFVFNPMNEDDSKRCH